MFQRRAYAAPHARPSRSRPRWTASRPFIRGTAVPVLSRATVRTMREAEENVPAPGFEVEVCLDDVPEVGRFVELEIQAPEEQLDAARTVLLNVAAELGLSVSERRSYLELLLLSRGERGV